MKRISFLSAALLLSVCFAIVPSVRAADEGTPQQGHCDPPRYPKLSVVRQEEGLTVLAFLIRSDGSVKRVVVTNSSGSPLLDQAAIEALSTCIFKPATHDGKPIESWSPAQWRWSISEDDDMALIKHQAKAASNSGDFAARYHLSLLYAGSKKSSERKKAAELLRSAADAGWSQAQFDIGRNYERGIGVDVDLEEALRWYGKAAAQGNVLARQRLELGELLF
jgi:TonB family protein